MQKSRGMSGSAPWAVLPSLFPAAPTPRRASRARALQFAEAQQKQGQEGGLDTPQGDASGLQQEGGSHAVLEGIKQQPSEQGRPAPSPPPPQDATIASSIAGGSDGEEHCIAVTAAAAFHGDGGVPAVTEQWAGGSGDALRDGAEQLAASGSSGDAGVCPTASRGGAVAAVCTHAACSAQRFCFLSELRRVRQSYLDGGRTDQFKKKAIDKAIKRVGGGGSPRH